MNIEEWKKKERERKEDIEVINIKKKFFIM